MRRWASSGQGVALTRKRLLLSLTDAGLSPGKPGFRRFGTIPADAWALGLLVVLTGLATWHLAYYDVWLTQQDIINFFVPWYGYLGQRLSEGAIPGWIPYAGGGAPFAGDPQSGWMYFPAMALFPFFSLVTAFKLLIGLQLLICGVTMHLFARVMRLGVAASLVAAIVFEFNPSPTTRPIAARTGCKSGRGFRCCCSASSWVCAPAAGETGSCHVASRAWR